MKNILYLHTGSNVGDRLSFLEFARKEINKHIGLIKKVSSVYKTKAWGVENQADFLNQAIKAETELHPNAVLKAIKKIEAGSGRKTTVRWGSRTLDIDILFFNEKIIETRDLTIPHPMIQKRNFVLIPLNEIAPGLIHPVFGKPISRLLEESEDDLKVYKCEFTPDDKDDQKTN